MKKLFINNKGHVVIKNVREPLIETKGSLVRTSYALISPGTELMVLKSKKIENMPLIKRFIKSEVLRTKIFSTFKKKGIKGVISVFKSYSKRGEYKNFKSPSINLKPIGYSCSGIVKDSNIDEYRINDRIACAGINHAEVIFAPKNLSCKIPKNVSLEQAAFTTLGAIALHGIHRADIKSGEKIGIIGAGLIGLITIQIAKACGATVFASDLINKRLNLAKRLGADIIVNPLYHNSKIKVNALTAGKGLDSIIICASSTTSKPLDDAIDLIRDNGKIVMLGGFPIKVDRSKLYYKEADLLISRSYGPGRYDPHYEYEGFDYPEELFPWTVQRNMEFFLKLLSEKKIKVNPLISDIIPAENANKAYKQLEIDSIKNIAILLKFTDEKESIAIKPKVEVRGKERNKLVLGIIGCGAFPQARHLPYIISNPYCKIKGICTRHQKSAEICKNKYRPEFITTNYKKILKDPEIETVFIYTRHDTHYKFTVKALKAGKNVFVEKPMGLSREQCIKIRNTVKETKKQYIIGFNRRYSPLIKLTKELLKERDNPIIINYRIASNYIPGDHWIFDPDIGGGPIIGEFCHFLDLILYLMRSEPIELIARGGSLSHKGLSTYDTCSVIIKFENSSIANLIFTDLNGPDMPKERIEVFSGESAIVIEDFKEMKTSGFDFGNKILYEQDKGHKNEINNIISVFLGVKSALINEDDAFRAMDLCFKTIESIDTRTSIKISEDLYL